MCLLGTGRKFLGFMLTHRGIHVNPDKCQAILEMRSPRNIKEAQRLAKRITSLSRFLPRIAKKAKLIMNLLKKTKNFQLDDECKANFWQLKVTLASVVVLSKLNTNKILIVYLLVSAKAISATLVQEENNELRPIYFVSQVLQNPETQYQEMEEVALALVNVVRRLRQFFQSHRITV